MVAQAFRALSSNTVSGDLLARAHAVIPKTPNNLFVRARFVRFILDSGQVQHPQH
jgi:hypothetical protein